METIEGCSVLLGTNAGSSTSQSSNSMATYLPSHKPSKTNETCWALPAKQAWTHKRRSSMGLTHGHNSVGRQANTYIQQLCSDTRCSLEDLLRVLAKREIEGNPYCRNALMMMIMIVGVCSQRYFMKMNSQAVVRLAKCTDQLSDKWRSEGKAVISFASDRICQQLNITSPLGLYQSFHWIPERLAQNWYESE